MASGQTLILGSVSARKEAERLVWIAPNGSVLNVREARRTLEQNDKLWAMLSDVSRAMPGGRRLTADVWKAVFMNACGHAVQFETGLSGEPFPIGFRSSRLSKSQMSDLIEFILAWGTENGVQWSNEKDEAA
jgi:hypothetical protein